MSVTRQTIRTTIEGFLQGFVIASQSKNMQAMSTFCTEDCRRYLGPASFLESVGAPPNLSMSNTEWESQFGTMEFYRLEDCIISQVVIEAERLKAAAVSQLLGAWKDGRKISRTHVWFLDFTEDGKRVRKAYEHVDARESESFRAILAEYRKAKDNEVKIKEEDEDKAR